MGAQPGGPDVTDVKRAVADLLHVPGETVVGAIVIAAMADGTYMLLHTAASTATACDVAMQVFGSKPHSHDEVIGFVL